MFKIYIFIFVIDNIGNLFGDFRDGLSFDLSFCFVLEVWIYILSYIEKDFDIGESFEVKMGGYF